MYSVLFIIELLALFVSIVLLILVLIEFFKNKEQTKINIFILILSIFFIFINISNILELTGIYKYLDFYEDFIDAIIPAVWVMLLYALYNINIQNTLKKSRNLFKSIFDNEFFCMGILDLEGNFKEINSKCCDILDYDYIELKKLNFINIIHPEYKIIAKKKLNNLINREIKNFHLKHQCIRKNGSVFWGDLNMLPIDRLSDNIMFVLKDITEEKIYENNMINAEKMQTVTRIISGVAHDFNNKLTSIVLYTEAIKSECADIDKIKEYTDNILFSANQIKDLTSQLISYVKKDTIKREIIDIHILLENTIAMIKKTIKANIVLNCELNAKNHFIIGDTQRIENMLINIILNADDAIENKGYINIKTDNIYIDSNNKIISHLNKVKFGNFIQIDIEDNGKGIDSSIYDKIFEPFFSTKGTNNSAGMGLAVSRGIVEHHGGFITFNSQIDRGSIFSIFLPVHNK